MGQSLNSMTQHQQQSKDELLHQCVTTGNVEAIKALHLQGANLEWIDRDGKAPLIVACMDSGLVNVAKTLIELGANINAYRPGRHGGTPLHHAAKRGLEPTVKLLLFHGANAFVRNDDCQTPLDVARIKGHTSVVRALESHICYFSGWLREFYGPGFLEAFAPNLLSRKIWAVVIPFGSGNPQKLKRFELAIYTTLQDAQPRTVIALWKSKVDEPKFHHSDPTLSIFDQSAKIQYKLASANEGDKQQLQWLYNACRGIPQLEIPYKLASANEGDKQQLQWLYNACRGIPQYKLASANEGDTKQLQWLYNACRGIPQVMSSGMPQNASPSFSRSPHQIATGAAGLAMANSHQNAEAISANGWEDSTSADTHNGWGPSVASAASYSGWTDEPAREEHNGWGVPDSGPIRKQNQAVLTHTNPGHVQTNSGTSAPVSSAPSAPPLPEDVSGEGSVCYPSVENSMVDLYVPAVQYGASVSSDIKDNDTSIPSEVKDKGNSSSCIICWEAPIDGACIPCGHMAGCMSCLTEIKARKGVCPVCRMSINQIVRLYAV